MGYAIVFVCLSHFFIASDVGRGWIHNFSLKFCLKLKSGLFMTN